MTIALILWIPTMGFAIDEDALRESAGMMLGEMFGPMIVEKMEEDPAFRAKIQDFLDMAVESVAESGKTGD